MNKKTFYYPKYPYGQITTSDIALAKELKRQGYKEIEATVQALKGEAKKS